MKILVTILLSTVSVYGAASSSSNWGPQFEEPDEFIPSAPPTEMFHPEQEFPSVPSIDTTDFASLEPDITADHPMASRYFEYQLDQNNYDRLVKFIPIIQALAEKENTTALACYNFARVLEKGWVESTSKKQIFTWFHKAAELDEPRALYKLSQLYKEGVGCPKLPDMAAEKMHLAAKFGSVQAQHELGQYEKAAEQGYAPSQFELGKRYQDTPEEAMRWYKLAADQGHIEAACKLGAIYDDLNETENARKYWLIAATAGNTLAQMRMGVILHQEHDEEQAVHWYALAAEQKCAAAQYLLGRAYQLGQGVERNHQLSWEMYNFAANQGVTAAFWAIGTIYEKGSPIIIPNLKKALEWYKRAASRGLDVDHRIPNEPHIYRTMGRFYENGLQYGRSPEQAAHYYQLAVDNGDGDACGYLGCLYLYGRGVKRDLVRARELLESGVALGSDVARNYLGVMLRDGLGMPENKEEALLLFRAAATTCPMAQSNLGLYYESTGQEHDLRTASDIYARIEQLPYRKGSNATYILMKENLWPLDLVDSSYNLGRMYKKGLGSLKQNYKRAFFFYEYAAVRGHEEAMLQLSRMYKHGWGCDRNDEAARRWREVVQGE